MVAPAHRAGSRRAMVIAMVGACHPVPTLAVTALGTVLAVLAGNSLHTCVLVAGTVFFGQLSIGWSNDRLDAARDAAVGRTDKPAASGAVSLRVLEAASLGAVIATVVLSSTLGWRAALVNLLIVGCGWAYNLGLKATPWSWLPYAIAFGMLPAVATFALPHPRAPAPWVVIAGALLGVAAHLANTLPDLRDDVRTGVRGLPHRLGARLALLLAAALLLGAIVSTVAGPPGPVRPVGWVGLGVGVVLVLAGALGALGRPASRFPFYGIMALAGLDLVLLVLLGTDLG